MRLPPVLGRLLAVTLSLAVLVAPETATAQTEAPPSPIETAYLSATGPFRDRLGTYQERLTAHLHLADEGQLDGIALAELGDLTRELFSAHRAFVDAAPSARLDRYDRTIELALDRAYAAAVLLLRAQVADNPPDRAALIREAGIQSSSSARLFTDASHELRTVLLGAV